MSFRTKYDKNDRKFVPDSDPTAPVGTGTVTQINTGTGLQGGPITGTGTISLANTAVAAGSYGSATESPVITIDAQGRITSAADVAIAFTAGIQEPLGHDISSLTGVVSHWRILDSVNGVTSVPDVNGAHNGTAAAAVKCAGRPWWNSEGQAAINQIVDLANTAALDSELYGVDYAFMAWVIVGKDAATEFFAHRVGATGLRIFVCGIDSNYILSHTWNRHTTGSLSGATGPEIAPGLRHICTACQWEPSGADTFIVTFWVDGIRVDDVSGSGLASVHPTSTGKLYNVGIANGLCDCVLISGAVPTDAEVLAQYKRGHGIY